MKPWHVAHIVRYRRSSLHCCLQIYHQYVKQRKDFGRHAAFVDDAAEVREACNVSQSAELALSCGTTTAA